jgi:ribokinase
MSSTVLVVGSINLDVRWAVGHLPVAGETVISSGSKRGLGGKGANQAVAARALDVAAGLVGAVGDDEAGAWLLDQLAERGVTTTAVERAPGPSGQAQVVVGDDSGDNLIVVLPGANRLVGPSQVERAMATDSSSIVVAQQEVGYDAVAAALRLAAREDRFAILNAAPARELSDELLALVGLLVVNEGEATALSGLEDSMEAAAALRARGAGAVLVSVGGAGAVLDAGDGAVAIPAATVDMVVDTTGAGDVLVGVLAAALTSGRQLREAANIAVTAATWSVQHTGVRAPSLVDLNLSW